MCQQNQGLLSQQINTNSKIKWRALLSIVASLFRWLVCQGTAVWQPPDTLFNYFSTNSGASPLEKPPEKPPLYATTGIDEGMFFSPLWSNGTHRQLQGKCDGRSYWWYDIQTKNWYNPKTRYSWLFKAYRFLKPVWFQPVMGTCRFVPSCSQYAEQVFADWGFWRGGWLTLKRLVRCHPFSQTPVGTVDYPPARDED